MSHQSVEVSASRVALLREGYEALSRRDLETTLEMLHPEVDFYPSLRLLDLTNHYHGYAEIRELFGTFSASFESFRYVPERFIERGDQVAVMGRFRALGRGSGVEVESDFVHVHHFRGEKIIRWDGDTERNLETISGWE